MDSVLWDLREAFRGLGKRTGLSPSDPVTYAGMAVVLAVVGLSAGYLPARRATRVDPMSALRQP